MSTHNLLTIPKFFIRFRKTKIVKILGMMIMKIKQKSKAISPIIGMILILAIIAGVMSIIQSEYVPQWDYQKEAQTFRTLLSEMNSIPSILTQKSTSTSIQIHAGVKYPQYPFLINPSASYGILKTVPEKVKVSYKVYGSSIKEEFNSSAIVVTPLYLYMNPINITYEHGAVIEYGKNYRKPIMLSQVAFSKNEINIPIITSKNTSYAAESVTLHFYMISSGKEKKVYNLSLSFETLYPELWKTTLEKIYGKDATVKVSGNYITISFNRSLYLAIPAWSLSTQPTTSISNTSSYSVSAILVTPQHIYLNPGEVDSVSMQILDKYGNPMKNATVEVKVENDSVCKILANNNTVTDKTNLTTDFNGICRVYLKGFLPGSTKVIAKTDIPSSPSGSNETVFNVTVTNKEAGSSYELKVIHANGTEIGYYSEGCHKCRCRCSSYYPVYLYDILVKVTKNGKSVKNVPVNFYLIDSEDNIVYMGIAFTNTSGYAHLMLTAGILSESASSSEYATPQVLINTKPVKVIIEAGSSGKGIATINYI